VDHHWDRTLNKLEFMQWKDVDDSLFSSEIT